MPSIRRSIRNFRRARNDAFSAGVQFCDGCAKVTDSGHRYAEIRRSQASALSLYGPRA
ncbi:hypothetical protein [Streptomyces sp. NPDC048560]|uniref:hypothetical protein n=1 Tax=Streptomyces sp. NPDC048560 TaxID=3155488 RepID=UPI00341C8463